MSAAACLVCGGDTGTPLVAINGAPVLCNQLASTREKAVAAPRGDIELVLCEGCGHIWNRAFEPGRMGYTDAYENSLHFSAHYRRYAEATAERLIDRYGLCGKTIFEIGCGRGDFLRLLCEKSGNTGIGCDPGGANRSVPVETGDMRIIGRAFAADLVPTADLVCCRHVLEHVPHPTHLLGTARPMLSRGNPGVAFFEVPNALFVFDRLSIWDIIYEHVSYFTPASLSRAFNLAGYAVRHLEEAFGGQFLWVEALPAQGGAAPPDASPKAFRDTAATLLPFSERYAQIISDWRLRLDRHRSEGHRVVVWGGGSKGVMFLNFLGMKAGDGIDYVVDINPRKRGRFVPGTGQQIVDPSFLRDHRPDAIIVMNPEYRHEIAAAALSLGLDSEITLVAEASTAVSGV